MSTENPAKMQLRDRPEYRSKPKPLTVAPSTTVAEAVAAMCEKNFGSVIVVDPDQKVVGVMTERDLMRKIVLPGADPKTTKVEDIMTKEPRVAKETDDIVDWLRIMSNDRFRRLPVVDDEGRIQAVFTQGDFVSYTWPDLIYQASQLARASIGRNYAKWLILGGIALYAILMIVVVRAL